jgi:hypothetical protein
MDARNLHEAAKARRRELELARPAAEPDTPRAGCGHTWIAGAVFPSPLL